MRNTRTQRHTKDKAMTFLIAIAILINPAAADNWQGLRDAYEDCATSSSSVFMGYVCNTEAYDHAVNPRWDA